jgi:uncharacterized membrane protein
MGLFAWLLLACAGPSDDSGTSCAGGTHVTWNNWGDGFFTTYCRSCHSATAPDRNGAPESVNFDTFDEVQTQAIAIESDVLTTGTMPIGGGVTDEDKALLADFLACLPD